MTGPDPDFKPPPVAGTPGGPAPDPGFPSAPVADPAGTGRPTPARPLWASLAVAVSLLALLASVGSVGLAWYALETTRAAPDNRVVPDPLADEDVSASVAPVAPESGPGVETEPDVPAPGGTGEPPPLDERTVYEEAYSGQTLTLRVEESGSMYVDLDEPRANVDQGDDDLALTVNYGSDQRYLTLAEGVQGGEADSADLTPHDCAERIRTAPLGSARVPARQGAVLCVMTSLAAARAVGDVRRMVLLEVTGVGADQAVTVRLRAWNIPG